MYESFFNLKEKPFNLTSSPRFLFLSEGHKEALSLLKYGVMERKGFIVLTGEVGTGKTTMVRALLADLDPSVKVTLVTNPLLSTNDFINHLAFSVSKKKVLLKSKAHFLLLFESYLRRCYEAKRPFNLIIDEAHKLSFKVLEEIRLLSNMETGEDRLINLFLVGQPELNDRLQDPRCRSLLQRVGIRHHIRPLNAGETRDYVNTRLKVAGAKKGHPIFTKAAVNAIYTYSQGYPRQINILADNTLLYGFSKGIKKLTPKMVRTCYKILHPEKSSMQIKAPKLDSPKSTKVVSFPSRHRWKWGLVLLLIMALPCFAASRQGKNAILKMTGLLPQDSQIEPGPSYRERVEVAKYSIQKTGGALEKRSVVPQDMGDDGVSTKTTVESPSEKSILVRDKIQESPKTMRVKSGQTLTELAAKIYGRSDRKILAFLQQRNADIEDIDMIKVGQKITFPPLPKEGTKQEAGKPGC